MNLTKFTTSLLVTAIFMWLIPATGSAELVRCLTEPVYDVKMSSIVQGRIAEIHFSEGDFVEKESVILELESRSELLDVQRREVVAENLKATLERSEMLLENTSSISMEEVDTARSEYKMAQLELELAKDALLNKKLIAPFSGVVTNLPLEVGEYCEPPQVVLRLVDTREFYCVTNIDPSLAETLQLNDPVAFVNLGDSEDTPMIGSVVFISPIVDPASGLLRIKALFPTPMGKSVPVKADILSLMEIHEHARRL